MFVKIDDYGKSTLWDVSDMDLKDHEFISSVDHGHC